MEIHTSFLFSTASDTLNKGTLNEVVSEGQLPKPTVRLSMRLSASVLQLYLNATVFLCSLRTSIIAFNCSEVELFLGITIKNL